MEQKNLSRWLKCILIGAGICGILLYAVVFPVYGIDLLTRYPEFSSRFWPWMIFLWISGIPCFSVLVLSWKIAANIGRDLSFSYANAGYLKWISVLSVSDAVFFFIGNILMLLFEMSHPSVFLASFVIVFIGISAAVVSAVLSHLVRKAAVLQEQNDLTI